MIDLKLSKHEFKEVKQDFNIYYIAKVDIFTLIINKHNNLIEITFKWNGKTKLYCISISELKEIDSFIETIIKMIKT